MKIITRFVGLLLIMLNINGPTATLTAQQYPGAVQELFIKVKGLVCPFCSYGTEKVLKDLSWIKKIIKIDLQFDTGDQKVGMIHIALHPGKQQPLTELERILDSVIAKATYKFDGLYKIIATGTVERDDFDFYLNIGATGDKIYLIERTVGHAGTIPVGFEKYLTQLNKNHQTTSLSAVIHSHNNRTYGVSEYHSLLINGKTFTQGISSSKKSGTSAKSGLWNKTKSFLGF